MVEQDSLEKQQLSVQKNSWQSGADGRQSGL